MVIDQDSAPERGNGFSFDGYTSADLLDALERALPHYEVQDDWGRLVEYAMAYDARWSASAQAYSDLYGCVLRLPSS